MISSKKKARKISTFILILLQKNLPHQDCLLFLHKLVAFSMNGRCKDQKGCRKYLIVILTRSVWTITKHRFKSYTIQPMKIKINHFDKCYFMFRNLGHLEFIGISVGIDLVPFQRNWYLYGCEGDFTSNLIKTDKYRATKYNN